MEGGHLYGMEWKKWDYRVYKAVSSKQIMNLRTWWEGSWRELQKHDNRGWEEQQRGWDEVRGHGKNCAGHEEKYEGDRLTLTCYIHDGRNRHKDL